MNLTPQQKASKAIVAKRKRVAEQEFPKGRKIGRRIIISNEIRQGPDIGKKKGFYTLLKCECGDENWIRIHSLRQKRAQSCVSCNHIGNRSPVWTGYKDMPGTLYNKLQHNAKGRTRNFEFTLTQKYLYDLFESQNRSCVLTGCSLTWKTASLDRIDSSQGYVAGNVQWVTKEMNVMKNIHSQTEFVDLCRLVVEHNS